MTRLVLCILAAVLPIVVVGVVVVTRMSAQHSRALAEKHLAATAAEIAANVDDWESDTVGLLRIMAEDPAVRSMDPARQKEVLQRITRIEPNRFAHVVGPDGRNLARWDDQPPRDFSDRHYFRAILAEGASVAREMVQSRNTGLPALVFAAPIKDASGKPRAIMVLGVNLRLLTRQVGAASLGATGYSCLVDERGRALAHPELDSSSFLKDLSHLPPVQEALQERTPHSSQYTDPAGEIWLSCSIPLNQGWTVVSFQKESDGLADTQRAFTRLIAIAVGSVLMAVFVAWMVASRMTAPLRQSTEVMGDIPLGTPHARTPATASADVRESVGQEDRSRRDKADEFTTVSMLAEQPAGEVQGAEDPSQARSEFLVAMSHEIRTPVSAIIGLTSLALQSDMSRHLRDYLSKIAASAQDVLGILNDILDVFPSHFAETAPPVATEPEHLSIGHLQGARILVVEDNPINQQVAREYLEGAGLEVEMADNGRLAVECVRSTRPLFDAVLMDLQMPEMDGFEATRVLRTMHGPRDLPIIAMTAHAMDSDRQKCLDAGMNDHLAKPVDLDRMVGMLQKWIAPRPQAAASRAGPRPPTCPQVRVTPSPEIAGIDVPALLEKLAQNRPLMLKLLGDFRRSFSDVVESVRKALAAEDHESARRLLHDLTGVTGTLCMPRVAEAATTLGKAVRRGDMTPVDVTLDELDLALRVVLQGIHGLAPLSPASPATVVATAADPIDATVVGSALAQMEDLLKQESPVAQRQLDILEDVLPAVGFEASLASLRAHLRQADFAKARQVLAALSQQAGLPSPPPDPAVLR